MFVANGAVEFKWYPWLKPEKEIAITFEQIYMHNKITVFLPIDSNGKGLNDDNDDVGVLGMWGKIYVIHTSEINENKKGFLCEK